MQVHRGFREMQAQSKGVTVIRFEYRKLYTLEGDPESDPQRLVGHIRDTWTRQSEIRLLLGQGGVICHRLIPYLSSGRIGFYRSGIVLGGRLPAKQLPDTDMEICIDPDLGKLMTWVADISRYPLPLLKTDPGTVAMLLRLLSGVRLTASYGVLRGST